MATGSSDAKAVKLLGYDQFIEQQLRRTRSQVRTVDVVSGLLLWATSTLVYFLSVALADHWVIPGGLPVWARIGALVLYGAASIWYLGTNLLPLLLRRINPLYAAETIERSQPTLKNSLLNFLSFRARPQGLSESVYRAVEQQAAANLSHVSIETVVDRSKVIKIGYWLVGVLALCGLYKVLSPKDPLISIGRVVMPWADILPSTRVTINDIQPGTTKAFRGQQIVVSAEVRGLARDAAVTLIYSTADGQTVDRVLEMHVPRDGYRYTCKVPADEDGVQQTLVYRIVAGDARSREYKIQVVAAPTIVVDSVEYIYPDYTGLTSQKVDHQGDIKAIEGTRVIVHGVANQPIKSAAIDFDCDDHEDQALVVDGSGDRASGASVSFGLGLEDDRISPKHASYQLYFHNAEDERNQQPIRHRIEVTPDLAPEISFLNPKQDEVVVRAGGSVSLEITASDPDFALAKVQLIAEANGRKLVDKSLIKSPWQGQFTHKYRLSTKSLRLKAGDTIEYWAVAEDIKQPQPNRTETAKRRIKIVSPDARGTQGDPQQGAGETGDDAQPQAGNSASKDGSDGGKEEGQAGSSAEKGDQPNEQNEGDAGDQPGENSSSDDKSGDKGDKSSTDKSKPGDKQEPGDQQEQGGGEQSKDQEDGQSPGEKSSDQQKKGDQQKGDQQKGDQQSQEQNGAGKGGDQKSGQQQDGPQQPVPNDGSSDGDALEKILQHRDQEQSDGSKGDSPPQLKKDDEPGTENWRKDNKQVGGNKGGNEKPNDKQPQSEKLEDDSSGGQAGNETKGQEKPGGSSKDAKESGDESGNTGSEQSGKAGDKQGKNSQSKTEKSDGKNGDPNTKEPPQVGEKGGDSSQPGQAQKAEDRRDEAKSGNARNQQEGQKSNQPGKGEHAKGDDAKGDKPRENAKPREDAKGGSGEQEQGKSGQGKPATTDKGAPEAQDANRSRDKQQGKSEGEQDDEGKDEAQSPSTSKHQSDSKGQSEGDRSGGGKQGGGQKANQPGSGSAGKNTTGDEGAGRSDEQGTGETGDKAGDQQQSDSKTGKSGNEKGQGSSTKPGDEPGEGEQGPQSGDQPPADGKPSDKQSKQQAGPGDGSSRGAPQGGGKASGSTPSQPIAETGAEPGGDDANLEYARKATDLALQHLKDQLAKGTPDQELLDQLGWSREDLENFIRRWEQMRRAAREEGPKGEHAQRELDDALRSLGVRPHNTTLRSNAASNDRQGGLKESRRTKPPAEYAEQYKAYTQGTSRGGK